MIAIFVSDKQGVLARVTDTMCALFLNNRVKKKKLAREQTLIPNLIDKVALILFISTTRNRSAKLALPTIILKIFVFTLS